MAVIGPDPGISPAMTMEVRPMRDLEQLFRGES
jgi:hypothetical protein